MSKIEKNTDISIILPLFNNNDSTLHTINSILEQSFKNFELIIVDNSTDEQTQNIITTKTNEDCRIKYIKNEKDKTTASALKQGISHANSKYISIMEENCTLSEEKLKVQFEYLTKNQDIALIGTFVSSSNKQDEIIYNDPERCSYEQIKFWINFYNPICTSSIMFNKEIVNEYNIIYQDSLPYAFDYYFIQELITNDLKIEIIPKKLTNIEFINKQENTEIFKKLKKITNREIQYGLLKRFYENNDEFFYVKKLLNDFPFGNYDKDKVKEALNNLKIKNKNLNILNEEHLNTIFTHPTLLH